MFRAARLMGKVCTMGGVYTAAAGVEISLC